MLYLPIYENGLNISFLSIEKSIIQKYSPLKASKIIVSGKGGAQRALVERFIKKTYEKKFSAHIEVNFPYLMSVFDEQDNVLAAAGFRFAEWEPLFLEKYTRYKIEKHLKCLRNEIVEIGNLASSGQRASIYLYVALVLYLNSRQINFITLTGTKYLHYYFKQMGFQPKKICHADPQMMGEDLACWGSYYEEKPRVLSGLIKRASEKFESTFHAELHELILKQAMDSI